MEHPKSLGFFPGRVDSNDWDLTSDIQKLTIPRTKGSQFYYNPMKLDQGEEGACVGFGHTQCYNSDPIRHKLTNDYAMDVYKQATLHDDWPNEDWTNSSGTSVRAGAEEMVKRGLIPGYAFTYSIEEIAIWILNKGPVVIGIDWWSGMDHPIKQNNFYITPTGSIRGGHCTLVDGVRWYNDSRDYFRILNSWGPGWGFSGRCRIKPDDLYKLLDTPYAVGCTWVEKR